ncbi:Transforming acidic coiled-coil-containing protein 2 [Dermatophagoides pteronyssinus]|uniref:Transforming acidic coiled-coil-containing protein 2 n=1 Tax=Dermatophagoides pteronyssinus TaxID=6956 RepID=A0ABQ8J2R6_DERPT|nr:Transforming acidic coiled-coil-containing protein 2 [Dermatophagoides pteronyssinus]
MSEMINENDNNDNGGGDEQQFQTLSDTLIEQLDKWEYNDKNNHHHPSTNVGRISLYRQFDPLVGTPIKIESSSSSVSNNNDVPIVNDNVIIINNNNDDIHNGNNKIDDNKILNGNNNNNNIVVDDDDVHNQTFIKDETDIDEQEQQQFEQLEQENEHLKSLMEQMLLYNEEIINRSMAKITKQKKESDEKDEELKKNSIIISQLEEDINGIEKNYYEIHSRYDGLRTLVKEMDQQLSQKNSRIKELKDKIKEKDDDCLRLRQQADDAIETANQRLSNNNETVNLKAQVKILEMRVNGLQSQIEQKNRENEELSNIVNELIANQKS